MVAILVPLIRKLSGGPKLPSHEALPAIQGLSAPSEYGYLFARAALIKHKFKTYEKHHTLADRTLAMIFEKASTRTRVSFEAGMYQLGGSVVHLTTGDSQLGRAEPIEDSAKVISRMVDMVMIRTFEQTKIERFAAHSRVPVINGLTNEFHPCQVLGRHLHLHRAPRHHRRQDRGLGGRWQQHGQHLVAGEPSYWASRCMSARPAATGWTSR
jgi:hypothetical protein